MARIAGLGTTVPAHCIVQEDATELAESLCGTGAVAVGVLPRLYRRCGVRTRHSVLLEASSNGKPAQQSFYDFTSACERGPTTAERMRVYAQTAGPLACQAAEAALHDASHLPDDITHLITVSCSGFAAPGIDLALIQELGVSPQVARTHVGFMGCHGALNALRVAQAFTTADPNARALICAVELCSLHFHYGQETDKLLANAIFADGAAAVVVTGEEAAASSTWRLAACGSAVLPDTADLMRWAIGDHGFEMSLSPRVPDVIEQQLRPWLDAWLAEHGLTRDEVPSWAIHPGGPKILSACAAAAGLRPDQTHAAEQVLARYGNMSSATILFVLDELRRQRAALPCVALGFGPGLVIEGALIGGG